MRYIQFAVLSALIAVWVHGGAIDAKESAPVSKDGIVSCSMEKYFGKRGHRGKRGKTGPQGAPGTNSSSGVVAAPAFFSGVLAANTSTDIHITPGNDVPLTLVNMSGFSFNNSPGPTGTIATSNVGPGYYEVSFGGAWKSDHSGTDTLLTLKVDGVEQNISPTPVRLNNATINSVWASMSVIVHSNNANPTFEIVNSILATGLPSSVDMVIPLSSSDPKTGAFLTIRKIT